MILITGGAWQGKLHYGCEITGYGKDDFTDGASCGSEDIFSARGVYHFHEYLRRRLKEDGNLDGNGLVNRLVRENPDLIVITNELGCGVVPADPFDRAWRELTGRVCTGLASFSREVHRVVCGLGTLLKGEGPAQLLLLRHGKTAGNLEGRYVGSTDEELCSQGIRELRKKNLPPVQAWFSSPMKRCLQTVRLLAAGEEPEGSPLIVEDFRETDFGEFEYKNFRELSGDPRYQEWIDSKGQLPFPGGEGTGAFRERSCRAFEETAERILSAGWRRTGLVVHGGTIMSVMERFAGNGGDFYSWHVGNGEGYRIRLCPESWRQKRIFAGFERMDKGGL